MKCDEFVDFLIDYYEGDLPEPQRVKFEEHMQCCPPCVSYLENYKQTVLIGRAVLDCPDNDLPSGVPEEIVRAILDARRQES